MEAKITKDAPQGGAVVEPDDDALKAFKTQAQADLNEKAKRQNEIEAELKALEKVRDYKPGEAATPVAPKPTE